MKLRIRLNARYVLSFGDLSFGGETVNEDLWLDGYEVSLGKVLGIKFLIHRKR